MCAQCIFPVSLSVVPSWVMRVLQGVALLPPAAWPALRLLAPMLVEVRALQESATTYLSCVFPLHLDVFPNA